MWSDSACFFNDTATTEIDTYGHTLSLHDALPIWEIDVNSEAGTGVEGVTGGQFAERLISDGQTLHTVEAVLDRAAGVVRLRSEEHTSELQSLMRTSYAVFCLKKTR